MSNPEEAGTESMPASRKRRLLAIYIDFMIFSVLVGLADQLVGSPLIAKVGLAARVLLFAVLEWAMLKGRTRSPGNLLLGISFHDAPAPDGKVTRVAVVDSTMKQREAWYTILLAVVLLNEGLKALIRWSMWNPPSPFLGMDLGRVSSVAVSMASGLLACVVAYHLLRMSRWAIGLGVPYVLVSLLSVVLSWSAWDSWIAEATVRRREWQGLPVREGEIELMQSLFPEFALVWLAVYAIAFLFVYRRIEKLTSRDAVPG